MQEGDRDDIELGPGIPAARSLLTRRADTCYLLEMENDSRFIQWHHHADGAAVSAIFPDGCRDVLIVRNADGPLEVVFTELDFRPRTVALGPGVEIIGYRLRPGALVSPKALEAVRANADRTETVLAEECGDHNELDHAIDALVFRV